MENTNKLRAEKGLAPLRYDAKLSAFAQRRAEQIVGRFSHSLPDSELLVNSEANVGETLPPELIMQMKPYWFNGATVKGIMTT